MALKVGDKVRIAERDVTDDDTETGLYYAYFAGLTGVVDRAYRDGSVCVEVDIDSLENEMRKRHLDMQEAERKRWIDNLSGEVRSRLTAEQRQLKMSYKLLVSRKDLEPLQGARPAASSAKPAPSGRKAASALPAPRASAKPKPKAAAKPPPKLRPKKEPSARRPSQADLAAKEEAYLRSLKRRG